MNYIEKLNLQTEEVKEVENLEKHTIINNEPISVNKYNGHTRDFLALDGDYDDGFKQLKEVDGLAISCIVSKEVKEAREDINGNFHTKLKERIDSEVNNLNARLDSEVNDIKTSLDNIILNVKEFGAKGDGVTSDTQAINNTITALGGKSGTIFFPYTPNSYIIDNRIEVPNGVKLLGENTKLQRVHNYTVNSSSFSFLGNNIFEGFVYDGGLKTIPNIGSLDYTNYICFKSYGKLTVRNNTFLNSKGSFFGGLGDVTIYGNFFGEFGDHVVYYAGYTNDLNEDVMCKDIKIYGNTISSKTSTRDVFKFRNGCQNVHIFNNTIDCPKGYILNLGITLPNGNQTDVKNVKFTNNTIVNFSTGFYIYQNNSPIGCNLAKFENIEISNNTFYSSTSSSSCIGCPVNSLSIGDGYFKKCNIIVKNNTFLTKHLLNVNSSNELLSVEIVGNTFNNNDGILNIDKNAEVNFSNNVVNNCNNGYLISTGYMYSNNLSLELAPTIATKINIVGNILNNVRKLYQDGNSTDSTKTQLNENRTLILKNNLIINNGAKLAIGNYSSLTDDSCSKIFLLKNDFINNNAIDNIVVSTYPVGGIINN